MEETQIDDKKVVSSSSLGSSSGQPVKRKFVRRLVFLDDGQVESVQNKLKGLDLVMNIPNKKSLKIMEV
jgi:hypothetical protein